MKSLGIIIVCVFSYSFLSSNRLSVSERALGACGKSVSLKEFKLQPDTLVNYCLFRSLDNLEGLDSLFGNHPYLTAIEFPSPYLKPVLRRDSFLLGQFGDCDYLLGVLNFPNDKIRYLVLLASREYSQSILVLSINSQGDILDNCIFSEYSGDGGDSYITKVKRLNSYKYQYTLFETHRTDNERMDTLSSKKITGTIELLMDGRFVKK